MGEPKVYADFQNLDDLNRLRLTCAGTLADLARQGIELREGLALTLYMDDADGQGRPDELRAAGIVHHHEAEDCWVAAIDWSAIHHASDEKDGGANGVPPVSTALPQTDSPAKGRSCSVPGKP